MKKKDEKEKKLHDMIFSQKSTYPIFDDVPYLDLENKKTGWEDITNGIISQFSSKF